MTLSQRLKKLLFSGISHGSGKDNRLASCFIVFICTALCFVSSGCTGDQKTNDTNFFSLNLNKPEVNGREVILNGGVAAPVERIEWDWGDGQIVKHHFFPASHTYKNPGRYEIKVRVFDRRNRTSEKSVAVEIK